MSDTALHDAPVKRGRKPRFDRPATISAVADLFWARGYDGVALSDVMDATGLSKSSLYNSFGGKDALFRIALAHYHEGVVEAGADWLAADDGSDPWDKLDAFLSGPADAVFGDTPDRRGCFLCNTAADGGGDAQSDAMVEASFARLTDGLKSLLARAAPDATPASRRDLATTLVMAYSGMRVRSRHAQSREPLDRVRATLLALSRAALRPD